MKLVYWSAPAIARAEILSAFERCADTHIVLVEDVDRLLEEMIDADGIMLFHQEPCIAARIMKRLSAPDSTVRWLHFLSAGREGFDEHGYPNHLLVTGSQGPVAPAVAEHAMALLLAITHAMPTLLGNMRERRFDKEKVRARMVHLEGRTIAIVGLGPIGLEIALRAKSFGMYIIGISRRLRTDACLDESVSLNQLSDALGRADVVMLAIALTPQTTQLFDTAMLAQCRPGAFLVNVARGAVVDQQALASALKSGRLAGAAVDVTDPEPLPANDPFWRAPNLIVSPHISAANSPLSFQRLAERATAMWRAARDNQIPKDAVSVPLYPRF